MALETGRYSREEGGGARGARGARFFVSSARGRLEMDSAARICPDVLMEAGIHHHLFRRFQSLRHSDAVSFTTRAPFLIEQFLLSPSILSTFTFHTAIERFLRHVDPRISAKRKPRRIWRERRTRAPCSSTTTDPCRSRRLPARRRLRELISQLTPISI